MIIAISGLVGSGKDTVADRVAEVLGLRRIKFTFKDVAKQLGIPLMEYQRYVEKDLTIDREFDNRVVAEARKGNCVVSTWLGPWMLKDATLRVWLDASEDVRAERVAKRDKIRKIDALIYVRERDQHNRGRYLALYGIDILDKSPFDLILNTERLTIDEEVAIIVAAAKVKAEKAWKAGKARTKGEYD